MNYGCAPLRVVHYVLELDGVGGPEDEPVAHAVEGLEHQHGSRPLIRKLHFSGKRGAEVLVRAGEAGAVPVNVADDGPGTIDRENGAIGYAVPRAAIVARAGVAR